MTMAQLPRWTKNVHAKARHARHAVGKVRGALLLQFARRRFVLAHDVVGDGGVSCELRLSRPLNFNSTSWPLTSICGARPGKKSGR